MRWLARSQSPSRDRDAQGEAIDKGGVRRQALTKGHPGALEVSLTPQRDQVGALHVHGRKQRKTVGTQGRALRAAPASRLYPAGPSLAFAAAALSAAPCSGSCALIVARRLVPRVDPRRLVQLNSPVKALALKVDTEVGARLGSLGWRGSPYETKPCPSGSPACIATSPRPFRQIG